MTKTLRVGLVALAVVLSACDVPEITSVNPLQIVTTAVPNGIVGVTYSTQVLRATGGAGPAAGHVWALTASSGPLPPGLDLSANGSIAGTPTQAGTFPFTVMVTGGNQTAEQALSITINTP